MFTNPSQAPAKQSPPQALKGGWEPHARLEIVKFEFPLASVKT